MPYANPADRLEGQRAWKRANPDKVKSTYRNWYSTNQSAVYFYQIKKLYGLTLDEYAALDEDQDWACATCGEHEEKLCVDHNHTTNKVRGLLCHRCNLEIGFMEKDPELTQKRLAYLNGEL